MTIPNYFFGRHKSVQNFDSICLLQTYPDSTVPLDDDTLVIARHNLICSEHPSNTKHAGVRLYCKICLPLRVLNISYLKECVNFELMIGNKSCKFVVLCISPSQSQDEFETSSDNTRNDIRNSNTKKFFLMTIIGDFNAKSNNWFSHDKISFEDCPIQSITSQFGLDQLINECTHSLQNSSLCIDLIFTSWPNIAVESGVHLSLIPNCHHQIVFAIFKIC